MQIVRRERPTTDMMLNCMWYLVRHDGCHRASAIARHLRCRREEAAAALRSLMRAGLITARLGEDGGYTLKRSASQISVWEVLEATGSPLARFVKPALRPELDHEAVGGKLKERLRSLSLHDARM